MTEKPAHNTNPTEELLPSAFATHVRKPETVNQQTTRVKESKETKPVIEPSTRGQDAAATQVIERPTTAEQIKDQRAALARAVAREDALEGPRTLARVLQVLLAVTAPVAALALVVRTVASPLFLRLEYRRPGFPADEFGWDTAERTTLGSYGVDYLFNHANSSYLANLRFNDGSPVFTDGEVAHMVDVKALISLLMNIGIVTGLIALVSIIVLYRIRKGGIRRGLFAGALWFTVALIVLAVLAITGWEAFFVGFHQVFFTEGTWTFYTSDSLIRLYPGQFWIDAAVAVGLLMAALLVLTLVLTYPTKRRREDSAQAQIFMLSRKNQWAAETSQDGPLNPGTQPHA